MYPKLQSKAEWFEKFQTTQKYKEIVSFVKDYVVEFSRAVKDLEPTINLNDQNVSNNTGLSHTPRERFIASKILVLDSFRILEYMNKHGAQPIYDIGCGMNLFSNFYDVVGMDVVSPGNSMSSSHYKYIEPFGEDFIKKYENTFPCAIAINSLHFIPVHDIVDRIHDFAKVLKEEGLGYITFNLEMLFSHTNPKFLFENELYIPATAKKYINKQINKLDLNVIDYENKIGTMLFSNYDSTDGTLRILFAKT
jgi:hypothetical protein